MSYETLTEIPEEFVAGDTVVWYDNLAGYLPATWTLTYAFQIEGAGGDQQTVTAADNGDGRYLTTLSVAATGAFNAGVYHWQSYVTADSERHIVDRGRITVVADYAATSTTIDSRSHVKKTLDALESVLESGAASDSASYSIAGRSLSRYSRTELLEMYSRYKAMHTEELRREDRRRGKGNTGKVKVRFVG